MDWDLTLCMAQEWNHCQNVANMPSWTSAATERDILMLENKTELTNASALKTEYAQQTQVLAPLGVFTVPRKQVRIKQTYACILLFFYYHYLYLQILKIYIHNKCYFFAASTLKCDPAGPFKSCGGGSEFDDTATCLASSAYLSNGKLYCTQVHCCKTITHDAALAKAMALNGTSCSCNAPWPCVHVDHGGCMGSGHTEGYPTDAEIKAKCWDPGNPSLLPCVEGTVVIPAGISLI